MGRSIPFHENFEEINLRFYVRRKAEEGWRRGVIFIKEIVPRLAIALTARWLYNENYIAVPTGHALRRACHEPANIESAKYYWSFARRSHFIEVITHGAAVDFTPGSQEEFIAQHYWGYSKQRSGGTVEYRVDHPSWRIWQAPQARVECDVERLYGPSFVEPLQGKPASAFLAESSAITVYRGRIISG
jgi:uncharacterized protein YqjF (DUF2071 family)